MDRVPINDSHDGVPPAPSRRPAEERSVMWTSAAADPPAEASPFSPEASATDRPAGLERTRGVGTAIPPPPPPPPVSVPHVHPGLGSTPPSRWNQPPVAVNPPRPGDAASSAGGPPTTPPPVPSDGSPPLGPNGRGWRVAAAVFAVFVMALSLVAGGFALGAVLSDDGGNSGNTVAGSPLRPVTIDRNPDPALEVVPGPLADEDSDEPVAAVARVVSPAVVLIRTAEVGQGSGIVWDAANGYIVTNDHVVADASVVTVQFSNGAEVPGTVVGGDSARDIAVIQVDPEEVELSEAVFAPTATVEVGQLAVAIGSPFGLDRTVTAGIVSAVNRIELGGSDPAQPSPVEFIQTDAPINPGNSGGALADRQGRVIGMNTQIRTSGVSDGNIGVGFAVPSDTIVLIAQRIVDGESLDLAFLGIEGKSLLDGTVGALVTSVVEDAPAETSGIEVGDLIISLDGAVVESMAELAADIKLFRPDEVVQLEILRDGARFVAEVALGSN